MASPETFRAAPVPSRNSQLGKPDRQARAILRRPHAGARRAAENGPEFIESEVDYSTLLAQTGWVVIDCRDITRDYAVSCQRQLQADEERKDALEMLLGAPEVAGRRAGWRSKLAAIGDGLLRRELSVATPDRAWARALTAWGRAIGRHADILRKSLGESPACFHFHCCGAIRPSARRRARRLLRRHLRPRHDAGPSCL
jgi:hypothetical protein